MGAETLPLSPPAPFSTRPAPAAEPLLVSAAEAARLCGISPATWYRLASAAKIGPMQVRLGGRVLYRVEGPDGLRAWIAAGCPDRQRWQAMQAIRRNGRE